MIDITGLREDKRPQSSTIVHALLDRLEAAEKERDALRAKITEMEQQEPVAWRTSDGEGGYDYRSYEDNENYKLEWDARNPNHIGWVEPLYTLPGAQPAPSIMDAIIDDLQSQFDSEGITEHDSGDALIRLSAAIAAVEDNFVQTAPSEQDASVRKAWARFTHELHRSPNAPYPGMSDAFEQHFSQSFIDREWRAEAATWAAAWKAAKRHCAQPAPSMPELIESLRCACNYIDKLGGVSQQYRAMLAVAPEAKP